MKAIPTGDWFSNTGNSDTMCTTRLYHPFFKLSIDVDVSIRKHHSPKEASTWPEELQRQMSEHQVTQPCCALAPEPEEHAATSHPDTTCTPSAASWPQGAQGHPSTSCPSWTAPAAVLSPASLAVSQPQASFAAVQAQEQESLLSQARVAGVHTEVQGAWHNSGVHTTSTAMEASVKFASAPCVHSKQTAIDGVTAHSMRMNVCGALVVNWLDA
jgi:hypothetical protein